MKRLILLIVVLVLGFYVGWPAFSGYQIRNALKAEDAGALASKIDFASVRQSMRGPILVKIKERVGTVMKQLGPAAGVLGGGLQDDKIATLIDASLEDVVNANRVTAIYAKGGDFTGAMRDSILKQVDKMGGFAALLKGGSKAAGPNAGNRAAGGGGSIGGIKLPGGLGGGLGGLGAALGGKKAGGLVGQLAGKAGLNAGKLKDIKDMLFPKKTKMAAKKSSKPSSFGLSNIKKLGFAGPLGLQLGVARDSAATAPDVTAQMEFSGFDWKITKLIPNLDQL